jgi:hypothetical protein
MKLSKPTDKIDLLRSKLGQLTRKEEATPQDIKF